MADDSANNHEVYSVCDLREWDSLFGRFACFRGLFFQTTGGGPVGGYVLLTQVNPAENAWLNDCKAFFRVDKSGVDAEWVVEPVREVSFFYQPWGQLCVHVKPDERAT